MNSVSKYVVSKALTQDALTWSNSTILAADDVVPALADLKETIACDIHIMGSSQLVRYLVGHDLIDQFNLMIHLIILGGGNRRFPDDGSAAISASVT